MPLHAFARRLLAEDLDRLRRADEPGRIAASHRQARIDPNPHQIDAATFALRRLAEGGCILADEVGLGKTIEAGLVIAQRRAEGASRILLIVPKPLLGQWQDELLNLFGIVATEADTDFDGPGVWLVGREMAGSERGATALGAFPPFDLVVIDEAHEVFAGIHRRYRKDGTEDPEQARTAARVRGFLRIAPVLLLTATPMQNSLVELWSLVQYVDPTGTLLGDLDTFRDVFCADDDRTLVPGQEHELQRRLGTVVQRTLRRQAQEFLERPFTHRRCRLYEYTMSDDERSLYDDVTDYLMTPSLHAFSGRQRRLLLIGFHRRMASSIAALASSLDRVAARLRGEVLPDPEDDEIEEPLEPLDASASEIAAELAKVEALAARARTLPDDAKARCFLEAVNVVFDLGRRGEGSGKAVVFTESITTQDYVRQLLIEAGVPEDRITLFRGTNDSDRAIEALDQWDQEVGRHLAPGSRPSRDVAMRLALVHEFRTRSKFLVATEAGAKGLNLQFCETVINYDLPWNPQRIEQRIGRCHRYSQERDVTVVNFLAADNQAHRLTFEILAQKLDLFGRVLDASDTVLHEPTTSAPELGAAAVSVEFERDLRNIYARARTLEERTREIRELRDRIAERREAWDREHRRTSQIVEARFDEEVRAVFRTLGDALPTHLATLDADIAEIVHGHLADSGLTYSRTDADGRVWFDVGGERLATGDARTLEGAGSLNLVHPLVHEAIASARSWRPRPVDLVCPELDGQEGVLVLVRVDYGGFEPVQRLVAAAVTDDVVPPEVAARLVRGLASDGTASPVVSETLVAEAVEEAVYADQRAVEPAEQRHYERAVAQLERFVEDRILVCRRERADIAAKLAAARVRRDQVVGSDVRAGIEARMAELAARDEVLEQLIHTLNAREDEAYLKWREHHRALRFRPPTVTPLLRVPFRATSC